MGHLSGFEQSYGTYKLPMCFGFFLDDFAGILKEAPFGLGSIEDLKIVVFGLVVKFNFSEGNFVLLESLTDYLEVKLVFWGLYFEGAFFYFNI